MSGPPFRIEPLGNRDRGSFSCGNAALDRYFRQQVSQDTRRRLTACYVAMERDTGTIAGFYTLAACHIPLSDLPREIARKLPAYPAVPAVRIGRLAIDRRFQGQGLGGDFLVDAAWRVLLSEIAAFALLVNAKDDAARAFYEHHGFAVLDQDGEGRTLFLSLNAFAARLGKNTP